MRLIESYVVEVCRFVPKEQREEIAQDLRDAITQEAQEVADARGAVPIEADIEQVLAGFGHPLKVAGSYQPKKYLIGPELYPALWQTLRVVLTCALGIQVAAIIVFARLEEWQMGPWQLFSMTFEIILWIVVVVFAAFAVIEYSGEKLGWYENWQPASLSRNSMSTVDRSDLVTNLVGEGFFLLWWNDVVVVQNFLPADALVFSLSPVWEGYFWPLNFVFGGLFLLHVVTLTLGIWRRGGLLSELVLDGALIGLALAILASGNLLEYGGNLAEKILTPSHIPTIMQVVIGVVIAATLWDMWTAVKNLQGQGYGSDDMALVQEQG
ncbi:MAG: hypothetical protein VYE04_03420 [Pseudomonadota bacterium]|nr:hypothetical protein [Pseudomonadota bacterium]